MNLFQHCIWIEPFFSRAVHNASETHVGDCFDQLAITVEDAQFDVWPFRVFSIWDRFNVQSKTGKLCGEPVLNERVLLPVKFLSSSLTVDERSQFVLLF